LKRILSQTTTSDTTTGYNWNANVRLNNAGIVPQILQWSEVGTGQRQGNCIVIQVRIIRGIEQSGGTQGLRARMGITFHCYGKTPQVAEKLADGLWNALYATNDSNGVRKYISTLMTTIKKIVPIGMNDAPPQPEITDGKKTGWVQIVNAEAETQQAN